MTFIYLPGDTIYGKSQRQFSWDESSKIDLYDFMYGIHESLKHAHTHKHKHSVKAEPFER